MTRLPEIEYKLLSALAPGAIVSVEDLVKKTGLDQSLVMAAAKSLAGKGRVISAIEQAKMAYEIDPNSSDVALELGELLCRAGQAQKAIKLVSAASVQNHRDKARIDLTLGWANSQMGRLEEAETFLKEGIRQDATLHRLYFELGRVHQQRNDSEKAMQAYFRALKLIYGEDQR